MVVSSGRAGPISVASLWQEAKSLCFNIYCFFPCWLQTITLISDILYMFVSVTEASFWLKLKHVRQLVICNAQTPL